MKFLFDFCPILLFFIAFKVGGIFIATIFTILATVAQIAWQAWRTRRVDAMLWISLVIVTILGGATLIFHDETFIKWKPTVLYWFFATALLIAKWGFSKNFIKILMKDKIALPAQVWSRLNLSWALFFLILGGLNLWVAYFYSTDTWVNFKLFGSTLCMLVFIIMQSVWLSRHLKEN